MKALTNKDIERLSYERYPKDESNKHNPKKDYNQNPRIRMFNDLTWVVSELQKTKVCTSCDHELPLSYFDNDSNTCYIC